MDKTAHHIKVSVPIEPQSRTEAAMPQRFVKPLRRPSQPPRTLMRRVVKQPEPSFKSQVKSNGSLPLKANLTPNLNQTLITKPYKRLDQVKKSENISHFSASTFKPVQLLQNTEVIEVAQPPRPEPRAESAVSQPSLSTDEVLQRALMQANSHLEPAPMPIKLKKRRLRNVFVHH